MGAGPWSASPSTTRPFPSSLTASNGSVMCRRPEILWNLGFYGDALSEGQTFSSYENQISGRFAWVPILSTDGGNLLHIGVSERYGKTKDGNQAESASWSLGSSFLHGHDRVRREPLDHHLDRDVLAPAFSHTGWRVPFRERRRASFGRPALPRRRGVRNLAHHGRDAHVQLCAVATSIRSPLPARSSLAVLAPGRSSRTAHSRTSTTRRSRRQVLAPDTHAQLVSLGSGEARGRLRLQFAQ